MIGTASVLVCGMGGLGCPVAMILAKSGVTNLVLVDDDVVSLSNLHRQVLFDDGDIGKKKVSVAKEKLEEAHPNLSVTAIDARLLPENVRELVRGVDLIIEGSDNFPTKFMVADACHVERKPVVHGAAIKWRGTAMFVSAAGAPCYRCLFEDLPGGEAAPNCAEAGVVGPVVGVVGAFMVDLALRAMCGEMASGELISVDGKRATARKTRLHPRRNCSLCGEQPTISSIEREQYVEGAYAEE